jgi:DNA-binding response OmpR family regulator
LPGTTGETVCRKLLENEATARVPVLISSALRNRAFAHYTDFPNVVDQIPKPFTPELLKSGVANALQTGAMVVQAQSTGCAMPEIVSEIGEPTLEGTTAAFPLRAVLDFLNNAQQTGRLMLEMGRERIDFALAAGRIQAVFSPTWTVDRLTKWLSQELAELAPLAVVTLGERQDAPMSGLVRLLERSLSDPRRLRALLRFQAAVLAYHALVGEPGKFAFEPRAGLPPMFQAFPLQVSLPSLLVEGVRLCAPKPNVDEWSNLVFARQCGYMPFWMGKALWPRWPGTPESTWRKRPSWFTLSSLPPWPSAGRPRRAARFSCWKTTRIPRASFSAFWARRERATSSRWCETAWGLSFSCGAVDSTW